MSALVFPDGTVRQLDGAPEPEARITEEDVARPDVLARILVRLSRDLARLRRRWAPRHITFRDVRVGGSGSGPIRLQHDLRGRVDYLVTSWRGDAGAGPADLQVHPSTDARTLALVSYRAGIATIRVEEAG